MVLNLVNYFLHAGKRAEGGQARTMGTQRCPVATDRTGLATAATLPWPRPLLAGHTTCAQWNPVGLGHRGTMAGAATSIRRTRLATAASSSGCERANWSASWTAIWPSATASR